MIAKNFKFVKKKREREQSVRAWSTTETEQIGTFMKLADESTQFTQSFEGGWKFIHFKSR